MRSAIETLDGATAILRHPHALRALRLRRLTYRCEEQGESDDRPQDVLRYRDDQRRWYSMSAFFPVHTLPWSLWPHMAQFHPVHLSGTAICSIPRLPSSCATTSR